MILGACSQNTDSPKEEDVSYTLMIYMCGSDLESVRGYASGNIADMLSADIPQGANILIQTGGSRVWRDERIPDSKSARFELQGNELKKHGETFDADMGDAETLSEFISFCKTNFPAREYSLILWDHGTGSNDGICYDELYKDSYLSLSEISDAVSKGGVPFEFIGFDACLMATYDAVIMLKDYADYLIASQELEPGSGWNYSALASLGKSDFYDTLLAGYEQKQSSSTYYTLSVIDLKKSDKFTSLMDELCTLIHNFPFQISTALNSMQFGVGERGQSNSGLFDMRQFAYNMGMYNIEFSDVIRVVNGSARKDASGISIFFPQNDEQFAKYQKICVDQNYLDTLDKHFTERPEGEAVRFEQRGFVFDNKLRFTLTEDSLKFVRSVRYELHVFSDNPEQLFMYSVGTDNDISKASAMYTVDFEGRWIWLGGYLLHCDVNEEQTDSTLFSARVRIGGKDALMLFSYNNRLAKLTAEGYAEIKTDGSRILPLTDGTEVEILYYDLETETYITEGTAVWGTDELKISVLPAATYQIISVVTDIYGYEYESYTAFVEFDGKSVKKIEVRAG